MSKIGASVLRGAREARAHAKEQKLKGRVSIVFVPDRVDVAQIRRKLQLSQTEFAAQFGFSVHTVRDWEQKRRNPESPTRAFLKVIEKEPEAVRRALTG
ncbi:MAG: type II toxin-antitoxin system MqsA family antitoxin [SAR324 cluster bacterium]|nr:type II toxin-antitoxin system MqsA family antitoxin [SAR324 cluster bacterium]